MIIEVDLYSQIRCRYEEGESQRSIAKTLGISRQAVKKYCEGNTHPDVRKSYSRVHNVITKDVKNFIISCFKQDREERLSKQKHTAKRIRDRLVTEKDFQGSYSTIREAVHQLRAQQIVPPQADIRLEYDAGDAAQIDWGEATIYLNNQKRKINFFCGRLCYKDQLPSGVVPTVDMIHSQLHETTDSNIIYLQNDIPVTQTDLTKYDEKCGVAR